MCSGAEAVFRSLAEAGKERWLLGFYREFPGFADLAELVYEEVATHRSFLSKLDRIYSGPGLLPLSYVRVRFVFLRGLALIYLIAFASLWGKSRDWSGSRGIVPAASVMETLKVEAADQSCRAGTVSCRAHAGMVERERSRVELAMRRGRGPVAAVAVWHCAGAGAVSPLVPLSFAGHGLRPFLNFQWDSLLLETGFLAIFFAPLQWVERPVAAVRALDPGAVAFALADLPADARIGLRQAVERRYLVVESDGAAGAL